MLKFVMLADILGIPVDHRLVIDPVLSSQETGSHEIARESRCVLYSSEQPGLPQCVAGLELQRLCCMTSKYTGLQVSFHAQAHRLQTQPRGWTCSH